MKKIKKCPYLCRDGSKCLNYAQNGSDYCHVHEKMRMIRLTGNKLK